MFFLLSCSGVSRPSKTSCFNIWHVSLYVIDFDVCFGVTQKTISICEVLCSKVRQMQLRFSAALNTHCRLHMIHIEQVFLKY